MGKIADSANHERFCSDIQKVVNAFKGHIEEMIAVEKGSKVLRDELDKLEE